MFVQNTVFQFIRDYETVKIEQDIANEYVLVFQEEDDGEDALFEDSSKRPKAAYYKNIERKINLKKKRVNVSGLVLTLIAISLTSSSQEIRYGL
jgi:RNA polymerase II-associated factor 1